MQKIPYQGQMRDATLISTISEEEKWNGYELDDGTVIRLKLVVQEIWRIDGAYDDQGNPAYIVKSSNIMNVRSPDTLKKKTS